jgi:hypothetical protein
LELGQAVAHLGGHGEVVLAFVAFERLGERGFGLVSLAGGVQHLGEVAKRVSLVVEPVRALDALDRVARERFSLHVLAKMSLDERLNLTQARLPQRALSNVEFVPELWSSLGRVVPSEREQLTAQHRCDGGEVEALVAFLEQVVQREEIADGGLMVA